MNRKHKYLVGMLGVSSAVMPNVQNLCTGSCGSCGGGCISGLGMLAVAGWTYFKKNCRAEEEGDGTL